MSSGDGRTRKTKLEKIAELEGKLKILKEENIRLKEQQGESSGFGDWSSGSSSPLSPSKTSGDVEKLKDALKSLKRVTIKQEMSLSNLRQKSKQRRREIEQKDEVIKKLQQENRAFRIAHDKIRSNGDGGDISILKSKIADLELQLAKEETTKEEKEKELKKSQDGISSLQIKLATIQGAARGVSRHSSNTSLSSASFMSDGTSGEDLARLKKELAKKAEKIANLQYDLEAAKDEIHDLKQRSDIGSSFPLSASPGSDDFFETDNDDDGFWGN